MSETVRSRAGLIQPAVLIVCDLVMLEAAFLAAYWFRFHAGLWPAPLGIPPLGLYLPASVVVLMVFFGLFYTGGMYAPRGGRSIEEELTGLFKAVVLGSLLVLALAFFLQRTAFSRSFFGLFFLSCFFFLTLGRILARGFLRRILQRGMGATHLLLIGDNPMRERVLRAARELPGLALKPIGWLRVGAEEVAAAGDTGPPGLPCLGGIEDVDRVVQKHHIDRVVLTLPFDQLPLVRSIAARFADLNTDLQFVPDLLALHTSRMRLTEIAGIPFISVREVALSGADRIVKRTFDLISSGLGLLVLSPLLGLLALWVRAGSPGPIFYRQSRVGQDGREFQMIKFRTMRVDAEAVSGPVWTVENDPRITASGRFLRRLSLDELPQLWNVLVGDMSLVGPRPERKVFVEQFRQRMPRYFERHRVRSGLTGWAQVHGLRGNTSIEERTLYDLHYLENWSLALDVKIILMTIHHVLRGENAY
jgi:exopolysaccharide biosynthesis polyprenyl glycosylphosphotransferase